MKLSKKGFRIVEVPSLVVVLLVIAIVLGVGASILGNMQTSVSSMTDTTTAFYGNSSFTANNVTTVDFTPADLLSDTLGKTHIVAASCTGVVLTNGTNKAVVTSSFTVSGCTALLSGGNEATLNASTISANFTYSYNRYFLPYNITDDGLLAQEDLSEWQATWVVIIAAAVVIGIVGRYLFFK